MTPSSVKASDIRSPWARLAFFLLSAIWAVAAWLVLLEGGFHKTYKYSRETTFVGGAGGVFMAVLFFLLAAIAGSIVLRSLGAPRSAFAVLAVLIFAPPCWFFLRA